MTSIGIYVGTDPASLLEFEQWFGQEVDFVRAHGDRRTWDNYVNSLDWVGGRFEGTGRTIYWSVPMFAEGGNLSSAASGSYDAFSVGAAEALLRHSPATGDVFIRVGEEFNGSWMPWAAKGQPQAFIDAYRKFVDAFRTVSDRFIFEWNVNLGDTGMNPEDAYPGDSYVDVIGMDFYYDLRWESPDSTVAFNTMVGELYGLQWLEDFAASHGKPTAYSEWGIDHDNAGVYVDLVAKWFRDHDVLYQSYYNSNGGFPAKLSQYPATAEAFRDAFTGEISGLPLQISDLIVNLIDADTNMVIQTISDGDFLDPAVFTSGAATISVEAAPGAPAIGSIRLTIGPFTRLESASPYTLFGDFAGDFTGGLSLEEGQHILRLEVFAGSGGAAPVLGDFSIGFTVGVEATAPVDPVDMDPVVQAALEALAARLTATEAVTSINTTDLASLQLRVAAGETARVAMSARMLDAENRLSAGETATAAVSTRMLAAENRLTAGETANIEMSSRMLAAEYRLSAGAAGLKQQA